jgi:hypothetical protein
MVTVPGIVLRIGTPGLTVVGPNRDVVHTVLWKRVKGLDGGELTALEDGSPARSIEVELDDRVVRFLVPAEVLNEERLVVLSEIVGAHVGPTRLLGGVRVKQPAQPAQPGAQPVPAAEASPAEASPAEASPAEASPAEASPAEASPAPEPRRVFVPSAATGVASNPLLPPPPPSSKVAMPPAPADLGAAGQIGRGAPQDRSEVARARLLADRDSVLPPAVPPARRVEFPSGHLAHGPSLLPPPPPIGSWSRLPPPPAILELHEIGEPASDVEVADPGVEVREPGEVLPQAGAVLPVPSIPVPSIGPTAIGPTAIGPTAIGPTAIAPTGKATGVAQVQQRRRHRNQRSRRNATIGGGIVLVLAVVGGTVFGLSGSGQGRSSHGTKPPVGPATRDSTGGTPGALTGPPGNSDAKTVAGGLNIAATGLAKGWQPGSAPWSRVATTQSNSALAGCLGLPPADLGALIGTSQPGGPPVYSSGWIAAPGTTRAGFESAVVLTPTAATQESDLAALDSTGTARCLQGWFASLDTAGDAIFGVPTVAPWSVSPVAGERAAGFAVSVTTRSGGPMVNVYEDLVFLGAGRVEIGLVGESIGNPVSGSLEAFELSGLESRLRTVASS